MKDWVKSIHNLGACTKAIEWCEQFNGSDDAWQRCDRGDWMLWLLGKKAGEPESDSRRYLVLTTCACVRIALSYLPKYKKRTIQTLELVEQWARGVDGITLDDVRNVAATYAGDGAYAATAVATATAATAVPTDNVYRSTLKKCADIVRKYYPIPPQL